MRKLVRGRKRAQIACAACGRTFDGSVAGTRALPDHERPDGTRCFGSRGFGKKIARS